MKKRLLAMLLVLMLVVSLLPTGALADDNASNEYIDFTYSDTELAGIRGTLTVITQDVNGQRLGEPIVVDNFYKTGSGTNEITVKANLEIQSITADSGAGYSLTRVNWNGKSGSFSYTFSADSATVYITLVEPFTPPRVDEYITGEQGDTRTYRIYNDQIFKMLHAADANVSAETEIRSIKPLYVNSFLNDYLEFNDINRETEYANLTINSGEADVDLVQPNNIRGLVITYDNGNGNQSATIYSDDLRYTIGGITGSRYYCIELNDDSFHIVYFYNEPGSQAGNNYFLYAVRFVEHGTSLGTDMPPQPDYGTGNTYMFVNWEQGSYDGTGDPFLSTTVVNEDLTVFAKKVSSPDDGGTEIWVMNYEDDQLLKRVAELYNETYSPSIDVADIDLDSVKISVYDNSKSTNQDYYSNGWRNDEEYYYVCNYNVPAGLPTLTNNHVAFNDIQSITVFFSLVNSGIAQVVQIPVGENPGDIAKSHSAVDNIIELRIIQPSGGPGGDDDKVNYTVNYYYDGVLDTDKTETLTGTVGDIITTVPDKSSAGYCLDHSNLPFTLTDVAANNVITVYYATDANGDEIPDSKQVFIKYVSSNADLGTVSPGMQVVTFADGVSSDVSLSSTATAKSGAEFVNWTDERGFAVSDEEVINYTLKSPELGKTYTFTANFKIIPVVYATLTYNANGGIGAPDPVTVEKKTTVPLSEAVPTHADADGVKVVFGGWSLDNAVVGQIYDKDGEPGGIYTLSTITMTQDYTLYAVWGLDTNGNGIADFNEQQYTVTYKDGASGKVFKDQVYSGLLSGETTPRYKGFLTHPDGLSFTGWDPEVSATVTGNVTYTATWNTPAVPEKPDAPTAEDLAALKLKVQIDCIDLGVHPNRDYAIEDGTFTTDVKLVNGEWQCALSVEGSAYLAKYNAEFGKHGFSGSSTKTKTLVYGAAGWTLENPSKDRIVFDVRCVEPEAPTYDVLKDMIKVQIDCINKEVSHSNADYDLIENSYDLGTLTANADGTWSCTLTVKSDAYIAKYNETQPGHTLADAYASKNVALVYSVDGKWSRADTSNNIAAVFDVKCAAVPVTPIIPLPTVDEIAELIDSKIIVDCVNVDAAHASKNYGLVDDALVNVAMTGSTTVKVTLSANVYLAQYNDDDASAKHSLASGQSATVTFTLKYVDSKWTLPADAGELPATIKVVCDTLAAPKAPTEDELKALFDGKVFVDCVEKSWHPTYAYGLLADGYTVAGPVKGADGEYTCTVTLLASAYLAEYNDDVTDKHTLASYQGNETVALKWTGSAWTVINGELPVTFDVVCDTWYPPIIPPVTPSEPVYTPNWLNTTDHFGYIIGYEDGTVKPNAGITRAEVATIFFRLLTDEARERFWSETNAYTDVADGSWYNNAISTLSNIGILGGYEDGTFRPNASITRAEFAKIAVSFFDWADIEAANNFVDVRDSAWYANYVAVAAKIGLIEGYGGNVFRPDATITRAEACTIINRTLGRAPDADHLLPVGQMNTWPDNADTGVWYYAQIQEATNSHDYRWIGDIEQWTAKLPEPDWDKLQY